MVVGGVRRVIMKRRPSCRWGNKGGLGLNVLLVMMMMMVMVVLMLLEVVDMRECCALQNQCQAPNASHLGFDNKGTSHNMGGGEDCHPNRVCRHSCLVDGDYCQTSCGLVGGDYCQTSCGCREQLPSPCQACPSRECGAQNRGGCQSCAVEDCSSDSCCQQGSSSSTICSAQSCSCHPSDAHRDPCQPTSTRYGHSCHNRNPCRSAPSKRGANCNNNNNNNAQSSCHNSDPCGAPSSILGKCCSEECERCYSSWKKQRCRA